MIDSEGQEHVLVVDGARPADEVLDEADEDEVEDATNEEVGEQEAEARRGGSTDRREKEGDREGEKEATITRDLQGFEERTREDGLRRRVEVARHGGVDHDQTPKY